MTGPAHHVAPGGAGHPLCATAIRSRILAGRVRAIHHDPTFDWNAVTLIGARDLPAPQLVHRLFRERPLLVDEIVRHAAEPILLLAAPDAGTLERAAGAVQVDYEPWEPSLSVEKSLSAVSWVHGDDNVYQRYELQRGDVARGFASADFVREDKYRIGHLEPLRRAPRCLTAVPGERGTLTIAGRMPAPATIHRVLCELFELPDDGVRLEVEPGARQEPDWVRLAVHVALLARKAGRAVRLDCNRTADLLAAPRRHPGIVRHRSGFRADGVLLAREILVFLDGGAYGTLSNDVLVRALLHASGPYRCPHVRLRGRVVATNTPPNGGLAGDGVPQVTLACELHLDRVAEERGIDPLEIRRRNLLRAGDRLATGQPVERDCAALAALEEAVARSGYAERAGRLARNAEREVRDGAVRPRPRRGIGLALSMVAGRLPDDLAAEADALLGGEQRLDFGTCAQVVEVEVDPESGETRVVGITACAEAGSGTLAAGSEAAAGDGGAAAAAATTDADRSALVAGVREALTFAYRRKAAVDGGPLPLGASGGGRAAGWPAELPVEVCCRRAAAGGGVLTAAEVGLLTLSGVGAASVAAISQAAGCVFDSMPLTPPRVRAAAAALWRPWRAHRPPAPPA